MLSLPNVSSSGCLIDQHSYFLTKFDVLLYQLLQIGFTALFQINTQGLILEMKRTQSKEYWYYWDESNEDEGCAPFLFQSFL
jgi:hypothetical protein